VRWRQLATAVDTLVVLMGVSRLPHVVRQLRDAGRAVDTPVAVVARATTAAQQVVTGTLETIVGDVRLAGIDAPAVIVVGDVVALADRLAPMTGGVLESVAALTS
jgi:siroheme synthase